MPDYSKLSDKVNNRPIQVQSAIEDGAGKNIENTYAKQDGYYSQLYAGESGIADNLRARGVNSIPAQYYFRNAGGSSDILTGTANITALKGAQSIVWNNLVTNFEYSSSGITSQIQSDGAIKLTGSNTTGSKAYFVVGFVNAGLCVNTHKYYFAVYNSPCPFYMNANGFGEQLNYTRIITCGATNTNNVTFILAVPADYDFGDGVYIYLHLHDLTFMYGAGNEPSTVAEFRAKFPLPYYAYNTGTVLGFNGTAIETVGFNAFNYATGTAEVVGNNQYQITGAYTNLSITYNDGTTATITPDIDGLFTPTYDGVITVTGGDSSTTCIHLTWSGYRNNTFENYWKSTLSLPDITAIKDGNNQTMFPNGLMTIGDTADEITETQAIKRIERVNLGSLSWNYESDNRFSCTNAFTDCKSNNNGNQLINCIIGSQHYKQVIYTAYGNSLPDMSFEFLINNPSTHILKMKNTSYTSASTFAASLNGVYLYYELETPITKTFDTALDMSYKVDDYGTEKLLPVNASTPTTVEINCDVAYALNAPDTVSRVAAALPANASTTNKLATMSDVNAVLGKSGTVTIATSDWSSLSCTKTFSDLGTYDLIQFYPASATDKNNADNFGLFSSASGSTVTFTCVVTPTSNITFNYFITKGTN